MPSCSQGVTGNSIFFGLIKIMSTYYFNCLFFDKCERQRPAFIRQDLPDSRQDIPRIHSGVTVVPKTSPPSNRFTGLSSETWLTWWAWLPWWKVSRWSGCGMGVCAALTPCWRRLLHKEWKFVDINHIFHNCFMFCTEVFLKFFYFTLFSINFCFSLIFAVFLA